MNYIKTILVMCCLAINVSLHAMEERADGSGIESQSYTHQGINAEILVQLNVAVEQNEKAILLDRLYLLAGFNYAAACDREKCQFLIAMITKCFESEQPQLFKRTYDLLSSLLMRLYGGLNEDDAQLVKKLLVPSVNGLLCFNAVQAIRNILAIFAPTGKEESSFLYKRMKAVIKQDRIERLYGLDKKTCPCLFSVCCTHVTTHYFNPWEGIADRIENLSVLPKPYIELLIKTRYGADNKNLLERIWAEISKQSPVAIGLIRYIKKKGVCADWISHLIAVLRPYYLVVLIESGLQNRENKAV